MAGVVQFSIYRNDVCVYSGTCKHSDAAVQLVLETCSKQSDS